jgi:hypothetical protein
MGGGWYEIYVIYPQDLTISWKWKITFVAMKTKSTPTHKIQYIYFREFLRHFFFSLQNAHAIYRLKPSHVLDFQMKR